MGKLENNRRYRKKLREYLGYGIIYKVTCLVNNKIYIGQTIRSLKERIKEHLKKGQHYIHKALNKYGSENFKWEIIFIASSEKDLDYAETYFIRYHQSDNRKIGYNLTTGGDRCRYNKEIRDKMSCKMAGNKNHRFGVKVSEETKKKMSESHKKRVKEGLSNLEIFKKKIKCIETNIRYESIKEAAEQTKIPVDTIIRLLRSGKLSRKHKKSFIYL